MKKELITDNQILEYLDGSLIEQERAAFEQKLQSDLQLQKRTEEFRKVHSRLNLVQLQQPSRNFTSKVMERLNAQPATRSFSVRNGILLLTGVLIAVGISSLLLAGGVFDGSGSIDLNEVVRENEYIQKPLPVIPVDGKLLVNCIILLNMALAFVVLDRAVLRPWFEKRTRMNY